MERKKCVMANRNIVFAVNMCKKLAVKRECEDGKMWIYGDLWAKRADNEKGM